MNKTLVIGFKGKNNASKILVEQLSSEHVLLTNSFAGLKRDIDTISEGYDRVFLFGVDKNLMSTVRIERCAEIDGEKILSVLGLNDIADSLKIAGIDSYISDKPTSYLCNEAYWHLLRKYSGRAVLIHIPTIKHMNENLSNKMKLALTGGSVD